MTYTACEWRSLDRNDERKWRSTGDDPLDDVLLVGVVKAVGYVCEHESLNRQALLDLEASLVAKGRLVRYKPFEPDSLWVGDAAMMQVILDAQRATLIQSNWPTEAYDVFTKLVQTDVRHKQNTRLYHLITDLFNSWCLWCEP